MFLFSSVFIVSCVLLQFFSITFCHNAFSSVFYSCSLSGVAICLNSDFCHPVSLLLNITVTLVSSSSLSRTIPFVCVKLTLSLCFFFEPYLDGSTFILSLSVSPRTFLSAPAHLSPCVSVTIYLHLPVFISFCISVTPHFIRRVSLLPCIFVSP